MSKRKVYKFNHKRNVEKANFVRPAVELVRFMQWLHDGQIDWEKIEEDDMWDSYLGAMTYIRERIGGSKQSPMTQPQADLLTALFKADRTIEELKTILPYSPQTVNDLIGGVGKQGLLYSYVTKRTINDLDTRKTRRVETRYYALTEFGTHLYLNYVIPEFGIEDKEEE